MAEQDAAPADWFRKPISGRPRAAATTTRGGAPGWAGEHRMNGGGSRRDQGRATGWPPPVAQRYGPESPKTPRWSAGRRAPPALGRHAGRVPGGVIRLGRGVIEMWRRLALHPLGFSGGPTTAARAPNKSR